MDNFDLKKYLVENKVTRNSRMLYETPQAPAKPNTQPVTKPDTAPKPTPRRRSVPNPSTSPTPAPKAAMRENSIIKKITDRYRKILNKLNEADYTKIFDPETLGKLKGSVSKRTQGKNPMEISMQMGQLAMNIMQLEKGNEDLLEQLAYDVVYETYPYLEANQDVIEIDAKIVPQSEVRDALKPNTPQEQDVDNLTSEEEAEMLEDIEEDVKKRRLINAITQGASTFSKSAHYIQQEYIDIVGGEGTSDKYRDLMQAALDMIDFIVASGMSKQMRDGDMESSASGAESVYYDFEKEKWVIKARAIVFPVLVLEIVKGMYEIIGLFGFNDLERSEKIVAKVDKLKNEPEDIAYGQLIAKNLQDTINSLDPNTTPEERDDFLQDIYKLPVAEFIKLITNVIKGTVTSTQKKDLQNLFTQMRQDKAADDADSSLLEVFEKKILELNQRLQKPLILEVSVEDLKRQFVDSGKVSEKDFKEVITAVGNKTAYATWLIKKVADRLIKAEDIYKYKDYFSIFDRQKRKYPKQDINQYKTQQDLEAFILTSIEIKEKEEDDPSKQKGVSREDKYRQFYIGSVDGFNVYKIPQGSTDLYATSCELGSGTRWCTATGKTDTHFKDYIKKGPLYIFIRPGSDEKYQFHYEDRQFMDKNDLPILKSKTETNIYNLFKFLEKREGVVPNPELNLKLKLLYTPEEITSKDLNIEGHLYLTDIQITQLQLPDNLKVGGSLNLTKTNITSLPNNLKVGGSLDLSDTNITSLPDNLEVGGILNLRGTKITSLPDNLEIGSSLGLNGTKITSLPDNLKVGGTLNLSGTNITSLPSNLKVGGTLDLTNTKITSLPDNLEVGGTLDLSDTNITSLPDNLKVGISLFLPGTKITSLPDNLKVHRLIYITDTDIVPSNIPESLRPKIVWNGGTFEDFNVYINSPLVDIPELGNNVKGNAVKLATVKDIPGFETMKQVVPNLAALLQQQPIDNIKQYVVYDRGIISRVIVVKLPQIPEPVIIVFKDVHYRMGEVKYKSKTLKVNTFEAELQSKGLDSALGRLVPGYSKQEIPKHLQNEKGKVLRLSQIVDREQEPVSMNLGRKIRGGVGIKGQYKDYALAFSPTAQNSLIDLGKRLGVEWKDFIAYRHNGFGDVNYVIKGENSDGKTYYVTRHGSGQGSSSRLYDQNFKELRW
jgi:hypothetical protein